MLLPPPRMKKPMDSAENTCMKIYKYNGNQYNSMAKVATAKDVGAKPDLSTPLTPGKG